MEPYAVCGLFVVDGKVLSVSRKDNPNDLGLPGGKIDEGETPEEALEREVLEETGLVVESYDELVTLTCCGKPVTTYVIHDFSGEIKTEESGKVAWVDWEDIMSDQCSFKQYNECVQAVYSLEKENVNYIDNLLTQIDSMRQTYIKMYDENNNRLQNQVKDWQRLCEDYQRLIDKSKEIWISSMLLSLTVIIALTYLLWQK